jgi:DNA-binding transcriptional MerR regulator
MRSAPGAPSSPEATVFDDGKAPDAFRTIGEVAKALGIPQHVLRYWEQQFPTLRPVKRSGGRRYYRPEDIALLAQINRMVHREGYTLRGARQALAGKRSSIKSTQKSPGDVDSILATMRARLAQALSTD